MPSRPTSSLSASLKRVLPKGLFGRALLIIILPIIIMQMLVSYIFFNAPLDSMLRPNMELSVALVTGDTLPLTTRDSFFSTLDRTLRTALNQSLDMPFWFDTTRYPNHIDIRVAVDEGVLRFIAARERVFAPTGFVFIFWLVTATALLTLVSVLFIRNQARPIIRLADAADAYGKGQDIADFKPSGAAEVRMAGHSFLKMRSRIGRFVEQRTMFLAGVSHDLRTPLTRLKLHLAMQPKTAESEAAKKDICEMEIMLDGYLEFARGHVNETSQQVDLNVFLKNIAHINTALNINLYLANKPVMVDIKTSSMQRAIQNLLSNSAKYSDQIKLSLRETQPNVFITIDDNGPGIPEEKIKDAFRPFHRLDTARNQNIEGVGLGLSIARDIIRSHGGRLNLLKSEMGGLKAQISLPQ